jgi:hypothetical protein
MDKSNQKTDLQSKVRLYMKNTFLMTSCMAALCFFGFLTTAKAQVPNGDFEYWKSQKSTAPENWDILGIISKTNGSIGGNAIKLQNDKNSGTFSMALMVAFDTGAFYAPKFAYSATPDSVTITYKPLLGLDTATVRLAFTKTGDGFPLAYADIQIMGNSFSWITKTFAVNYINPTSGLIADSAYILISSSDEVSGPLSSGSIELDLFTFKYANNNACTNIPNYSFENWHSTSVEYPDNWVTLPLLLADQGVKFNVSGKSSDKFNGSYALELAPFLAIDPQTGFEDTFPAAAITIRNGSSPNEANFNAPAFPINQRYTSFRGMIKSNLVNGDVAMAWVNIFDADSIVGNMFYIDTANYNTYTEFAEDITWDTGFKGTPDSACIMLYLIDRNFTGIRSLNSRAVFDNLRFDNWNVGVNSKTQLVKSGISPNPCKGDAMLKINCALSTEIEISVYNSAGIEIQRTANQVAAGITNLSIDLKGQATGIYYVKVKSSTQISTHKIILIQ